MRKSKWGCSFINRIVSNEFISLLHGEGRKNELIPISAGCLSIVPVAWMFNLTDSSVLLWPLEGRGTISSFCFVKPCGIPSFSLRQTVSTSVRGIKLLFLLSLEGREKAFATLMGWGFFVCFESSY